MIEEVMVLVAVLRWWWGWWWRGQGAGFTGSAALWAEELRDPALLLTDCSTRQGRRE